MLEDVNVISSLRNEIINVSTASTSKMVLIFYSGLSYKDRQMLHQSTPITLSYIL